ncbi:MAG: extracellular solute-binding protein, partial [Alphaproteobacteria bacterium]
MQRAFFFGTKFCLCGLMGLGLIALNTAKADPNYAVSPFGNPELAEDFTHFPYVNPDAPKGGNIVVEALGSFDSLNPYILKGDKATGIALTQDTLLRANDDEPFAKYGLLAQWVDVRDDGLTIRYKIRDEARFHDGSPVTAEDVVWSFEILRTQGLPLYRQYYGDVVEAKAVDGNIVEFKLSKKNIEMPAILGQFGIFSKADWQDRDFSKTTLSPFLGSGPYRIKRLDAGKFVEFERVQDYWGADLPVNRGFYNFDLIRYDYYRDRTISREAFKAGKIDFWQENSAKSWATAFDTKAVSGGDLVLAEIPHQNVAPMQGFVFNQRKPLFADPLVREALAYLWDFEWVNQNLMFNAYQRTRSFFDNSELAA